jgi:hypothetical protein
MIFYGTKNPLINRPILGREPFEIRTIHSVEMIPFLVSGQGDFMISSEGIWLNPPAETPGADYLPSLLNP